MIEYSIVVECLAKILIFHIRFNRFFRCWINYCGKFSYGYMDEMIFCCYFRYRFARKLSDFTLNHINNQTVLISLMELIKCIFNWWMFIQFFCFVWFRYGTIFCLWNLVSQLDYSIMFNVYFYDKICIKSLCNDTALIMLYYKRRIDYTSSHTINCSYGFFYWCL